MSGFCMVRNGFASRAGRKVHVSVAARAWALACVCACLAFLVVGCQPAGDSPDTSSESETQTGTEDRPAEASSTTTAEPSWSGRWLLVITEQTTDFHPMLFQIERRGGQLGIGLVDRAPRAEFKDWNLESATFTETQVTLGINTGEMVLNFTGTLQGDVVLGSVVPEERTIPTVARLMKTADTNLRSLETPKSTPGIEDLEKAIQDPLTAREKLQAFIAAHANSPLAFNAYEILLATSVNEQLPLEKIRELADQMVTAAQRWTPELTRDTQFQVIAQIDFKPDYREITEHYLGLITAEESSESPDPLKNRLDLYQGRHLLGAESADVQEQGKQLLRDLLAREPFDFNAIVALANYYERQQEVDEARKLYTKLAVLPGVSRMVGQIEDPISKEPTTPLQKSRALFTGDDAAFEKYLDDVYRQEVFYFLGEEKPQMELQSNRRVPLLELFTGAMCPPCVAGDLAIGGLEQLFPSPEIIAVRYHQHIPGPDPLTNSSGESRFGFYGGRGTPALFINGRAWDTIGGYVVHAEQHFQELKPHVASLLSQVSLIEIKLDAALEGDLLRIQAHATSLSKDRKNLRLYLLLVEPQIHYAAPNGIRLHEMVVRDMPGGTEGVPGQEGEAKTELQLSIPELRARLIAEVETFQKNRNYNFASLPEGPRKLRVVAFIQDGNSKEILQSTISPVIELPEATPAETPPVTTPPAAEPGKPADKTSPEAAKPELQTPEAKPSVDSGTSPETKTPATDAPETNN